MNPNKLFLTSSPKKQRNSPAQPESSAAGARIEHKFIFQFNATKSIHAKICDQCRLAPPFLTPARTRAETCDGNRPPTLLGNARSRLLLLKSPKVTQGNRRSNEHR